MSSYRDNGFPPGGRFKGMTAAAAPAGAGQKPAYESTLRNGRVRQLAGAEGKNLSEWDSYRRWLNRVQAPDKRRMSMDPALYTWKGYRNWSDKVRRDWKPDGDE